MACESDLHTSSMAPSLSRPLLQQAYDVLVTLARIKHDPIRNYAVKKISKSILGRDPSPQSTSLVEQICSLLEEEREDLEFRQRVLKLKVLSFNLSHSNDFARLRLLVLVICK